MARKKLLTAVMISGLFFSGCASQSGWTPTVDTHGDKNAERITADKMECRQLALEASGGTANKTAEGAIAGGALGAAAGAILGAATGGSVGQGAAIGAAVGGIGGGATQGLSAEEEYKRAFINCMKNRGHSVINP